MPHFNNLKHWICKTLLNTTLAYFDCTKPVVIQTNASEYGLGTALLQGGRPIAFASNTLTDVETRYTNIEHKCLSVWFGSEKFHIYIYGRHTTVHNDHISLGMIQKKTPFTLYHLTYRECYCTYKNMITHSIQTW